MFSENRITHSKYNSHCLSPRFPFLFPFFLNYLIIGLLFKLSLFFSPWPAAPKGVLSSFSCVAVSALFASFGYYANIVQQIEFIIHVNIQHLPTIFFNPRSRL